MIFFSNNISNTIKLRVFSSPFVFLPVSLHPSWYIWAVLQLSARTFVTLVAQWVGMTVNHSKQWGVFCWFFLSFVPLNLQNDGSCLKHGFLSLQGQWTVQFCLPALLLCLSFTVLYFITDRAPRRHISPGRNLNPAERDWSPRKQNSRAEKNRHVFQAKRKTLPHAKESTLTQTHACLRACIPVPVHPLKLYLI